MRNLIILTLLWLLGGCSAKPYVVDYPDKFSGQGEHKIFIVSHGWHSGIVINTQQALKKLPELQQRFADAENIEFGWGDEGFYQADEITSGLTLKALLWPTDTVIHAVAVPQDVSGYFSSSEVHRLCLNDKELSNLIKFISSSLDRSNTEHLLPLNQGLYGDSQFYKGVGSFHLLNTCNKWTAKALKSAGMDINPTFKLTAGSIMRVVKSYNQHQVQTSPGEASSCK